LAVRFYRPNSVALPATQFSTPSFLCEPCKSGIISLMLYIPTAIAEPEELHVSGKPEVDNSACTVASADMHNLLLVNTPIQAILE